MTLRTAAEVAQQLRVSTSMVYSLVSSGRLAVIRIGSALRFDPADIEAFLAASKVPARAAAASRAGAAVPTVRLESRHPDLLAIFRRAGVTPCTDLNAQVRQGRKPKARAGGR